MLFAPKIMRHILTLIIEISAVLFKLFVKQWEIFINLFLDTGRKSFCILLLTHSINDYTSIIDSQSPNDMPILWPLLKATWSDLQYFWTSLRYLTQNITIFCWKVTLLWCSRRCFGVVQELFDKQVPICVIPSHASTV